MKINLKNLSSAVILFALTFFAADYSFAKSHSKKVASHKVKKVHGHKKSSASAKSHPKKKSASLNKKGKRHTASTSKKSSHKNHPVRVGSKYNH